MTRTMVATLLLIATLLGGCAGFQGTPYNGALSCQGVGGRYTADGRCLAGSGA